MIVALINNKGGVAKTTTAVNIAAGLAERNSRVLLLDLDSQGAASLSLGLRRNEMRPSVADVILHHKPPREAIRHTYLPTLDLLSGSNELAAVDSRLAMDPERGRHVRNLLEVVRGDYAHIVIDCPPSMSTLSVNALVAADFYLVPFVPNFLALGGLASLIEEVNAAALRLDGDVAELLGFVLTMVDYRNGSAQKLVEAAREGWRELVFETEIRVNVKLAEAPSAGRAIFDYAPASTGAKAYRALCRELLRREKKFLAGARRDNNCLDTEAAERAEFTENDESITTESPQCSN